ncbi:hypothetical protein M9H77_28195 [Catharanthus roseus]|uniref:Uncharacterized protein n=1 Tax=Catharanthus roseus TaxID=4058 RepID=A0ACC0AHB1_CATRO|nr:hypothetical protein M9H77_28195 [Catharanthus roseus]
MWRKTKTEWFRLLKTKRGCRLLVKSQFLQQLHSYMQEEDLERTKKFGSKKVCLDSSFAKHNRMKKNLYHFKSLFLSKRRNKKTKIFLLKQEFTMKRKRKMIELPAHYLEVNHRTPKAVVSYGPNIGHIPHNIRLKYPNLLLRSGNGHGQNI